MSGQEVKPPRRKPGVKPREITEQDRRTVARMIGVGMAQRDVCLVLACTMPTLHKHFRRELDTAYLNVVARMRAKLLAKADTGDTLALIHVNKVLGWNDRVVVVDGGTEADPATLSDEAISERLNKLRRSSAVVRAVKDTGTVH